jgi:hypothetical protein
MGLSEAKKKELESRDFHKLFLEKKHQSKWKTMAEQAYAYAKASITDGNEPRPDDISDALLPILNKDDDLRTHQKDNHCTSRRYKEAFADYIVDQVIIEPTRRKADGAKQQQQKDGN